MSSLCYLLITIILALCGNVYLGVSGYVTEPELRDLSNGHTLVGQDIVLECRVISNKPKVLVKWKAPLNLKLTKDRINITTSVEKISATSYTIRSFYKIQGANLEDKSTYYCRVSDVDNIYDAKYHYIWVPVYGPKDHVIEFYRKYSTIDKVNSEIQVRVRAHPETTFYWIDKNNNTINSTSSKFVPDVKYLNGFTNYQATVKLKNIFYEDFGNYTLIASNHYEQKELIIPLNITGPPLASLSIENYNKEATIIKCKTSGYPKPTVKWQFQSCKKLACFSKKTLLTHFQVEKDEVYFEEHGLQMFSFSIINNSADSGILRAVSKNSLGNYSAVQHVYKPESSFEVYAENILHDGNVMKLEALFNENIEIICAVSVDDYYKEIKWYRHDKNMSLDDIRIPVKGFDEYTIDNFDAIYSSVSRMRVNIDKTDQAIYICKATKNDGKVEAKFIKVVAREQPILNVASNMQNKTIEGKLGNTWKFYCNVDGYPTPTIIWIKNNASVNTSKRIQIKDHNQTLSISYLESHDNGTYKCIVSNRLNQTVSKIATLETIENDLDWSWIIVTILLLALAVVLTFVAIKIRKEQKIKKELQAAGLEHFEKGAIEYLNPELRVEDQADLLPYDKKWEIPEENLSLGKELGSGAFGVVVKAELRGFFDDKSVTTVAVKSVNKFAGFDCIKALASELKIMGHLGKHVNIVNLIGACTKDIAKRKLLVVVEYCSVGNLHEHILYNRNNFIDQRNKDEFDWTISDESKTKIDSPKLNYITTLCSDGSINSGYEPDEVNDKQTHQDSNKPISSKDLLTWAFQITRGMEYLASRHVLHGDLAARNVLLTDNNVVKISDFGLARNLYKNGIYKKTEKGPLPVKWMAVESIGENIFSQQSDVWSFGVVLWEFFSLAKTPYPGMQIDQTFYQLLFSGYRMEKPEFCTHKLYEIMLSCWNADPMTRPNFTDLAGIIGTMLEESVVNHYTDMNTSYVHTNGEIGGQEDYLLMMSPPTFQNTLPSPTNFVNNLNYFHLNQDESRYVNIGKTEV